MTENVRNPGDSREGRVATGDPVRASGFSFVRMVNIVLRHRRAAIRVGAVVVIVIVTIALFRPRTYTAMASFMPQSSDASLSNAAGLAAQFGIVLPASDAGESPQFYGDLLASNPVIRAVVDTEYEFEGRKRKWFGSDSTVLSGTLMDLYEIDEAIPAKRREKAMRRLREDLSIRTDVESGVVSFSVTVLWPALAKAIAERMLELVNAFNLETRQTRAAAERKFVEERMGQVRDELRQAEDELQMFLQQNRDFQDSPFLVFQHDRLQREVLHRQQVVTSLAQSYEQARIEEVRNTPVITIVEEPTPPAIPNPRRRALLGLLGLVLGATLGIAVAFLREALERSQREEPEDYAEMVALKKETVAGLTRFLPRFGRKTAS